jgi:hypothetical protein
LLLVHTCGHEVTGLKTYRGPKRKEQFGVCSLPGYYVPEAGAVKISPGYITTLILETLTIAVGCRRIHRS